MNNGGVLDYREGTLMRKGTMSDLDYVENQRNAEASALGFIPIDSYKQILDHGNYDLKRVRWQYSNILIVEDNKDLTGFCYYSYARKSGFKKDNYAHIFQIVVRKDARRIHRALMMVDYIENQMREKSMYGIKARVAVDLESNFFWRAIGFKPLRIIKSTWLNQKESKTQRPLYYYVKEFDKLLFEYATTV